MTSHSEKPPSGSTADREDSVVCHDPWIALRQYTDARIALGRCGSSIPLASVLDLRLAHARAKDAVNMPLDVNRLKSELNKLGLAVVTLRSAAEDRPEYLKRPDLGRQLDKASRESLALPRPSLPCDIALVIGDGLSARAIHESAIPFAAHFSELCKARTDFRLGPVSIVVNCRVATGDEIGEVYGARVVVMLIGERPGLSSPNSMGVYLTHGPRRGTSDEARNCISNIRHGGLSVTAGVRKLAYLLEESFRLNASGVILKDRMAGDYIPFKQQLSLTGETPLD